MLGSRQVLADFDGGAISSDGGALLLRQTERLTGILRQFAACFTDHRAPDLIEHPVEHLLAQRVYGLAPGYEDLNGHDDLRRDPWLATVVAKDDPTGEARQRRRDRGEALAGKSTLNRLELTGPRPTPRADRPGPRRHRRPDPRAPDRAFLPRLLQGRLLPAAGYLLRRPPAHARRRPADIDACAGSVKHLERIVARLQEAWPAVKIAVRADSGSCREGLLRWCEAHGVGYVLGLAKDTRLVAAIAAEAERARQQFAATKQPARSFAEP